MDIGVVQNVDINKGTIDVLVHGVGREYIQNNVPIARNSDTISIIPKIGARCLIAPVGNELICMGYLPVEGASAEEANQGRDLRSGDFMIGDEENGQVGVLEGGMLVALANGTGMIIIRDEREVDIVGKDVVIDTPSTHKYYKTDDLGGADIDETTYSAIGQVEGHQVKANEGTIEHSMDRVKSVKLEINKGATSAELIAIGRTLQDLTVTIGTEAGDISLMWDSASQQFTMNVPGQIQITAATLMRLIAPTIALNCPGTEPMNGLINGLYQCHYDGVLLGAVPSQGNLTTVQGGNGA